MAERSEAKSAKRSFASKIKIVDILTRSFASLSHFPRKAYFRQRLIIIKQDDFNLYDNALISIYLVVAYLLSIFDTILVDNCP